MSAIDVIPSPRTAADLYEVFRAVLISPETADEEDAMLPETTVAAPAKTETIDRAAPPTKTAAFRCPTNTNRTAAKTAIMNTSGKY